MRIIVDTNIVFSALLNSSGKIGNLLTNSDDVFDFYTSDYLKEELIEHHEKIKKLSRLSDAAIEALKSLIFNHINCINTELFPLKFGLRPNQSWLTLTPTTRSFTH